MKTKSQQLKEPDGTLSSLNAAIGALDLARDEANVRPAKYVFTSARVLLTTIRVRFLPAHVDRLLTGVRRIRRPKKWIVSNWG